MKRLTLDYIRRQFTEKGYDLLSKEYKGSKSKLDYSCSVGHIGQITWSDLKQGTRCTECAGVKKPTIEFVRGFFEKEGYKLLSSQYRNTRSKLEYLCPDEHIGWITWNRFSRGQRCAECFGTKAHTLEYVQECFDKRGYKMLSTQYKNIRTKLDYECPDGHKGQISFANFIGGHLCAECAGNKKYTIEFIRQYFEKEGYKLLSNEYEGAHHSLKYVCPQNHTGQVRWNDFFNNGARCPLCQEYRNEKRLREILGVLYPNGIKQYDNLGFLGRQTVDFSVRELNLAFEYDGEHHFMPVRYGGMKLEQAQRNFALQQKRDQRKNEVCKQNGYRLIRVTYKEELSIENIRLKIGEVY